MITEVLIRGRQLSQHNRCEGKARLECCAVSTYLAFLALKMEDDHDPKNVRAPKRRKMGINKETRKQIIPLEPPEINAILPTLCFEPRAILHF